jgi:hypothetical protein
MKKLANIALLAGILGSLLMVVNYLSHYPIALTPDEPELYGEPLLRNVGSDVALVVDTAEIRSAGASGSFSATDWSYGWINLLLQEEKRFDIIDASSSTEPLFENVEVLIVTKSVTQSVAPCKGTTLYELPNAQTLKNLTAGAISIAAEPRKQYLSHYATSTQLYAISLDTTRAKALWALDGITVLAEMIIGDSRIQVSGFDFGEFAVRVQQGQPNDDFSVTPRIAKKTGMLPLVSGDLVSDSAHYERFEPFFDRFEHDFWSKINLSRTTVSLFDDSPRGAFVMSHDEEGIGNDAAWQPTQEQRWGVKSTVFVTPAAVTATGIKKMIKAGAEVGLHPDQYSHFIRPGLPGLRPLNVKLPIIDQKSMIESTRRNSVDTPWIHVSRNHWLLWDDHYTSPLRKLAAAGISLDLSYGPLGDGLVGYIFGTAFPFVPLDTNGFPLPILELPFLFQDDERFDPEYLDCFIDTGAFKEEIVNMIFHSNTMGHSPDTLILWAWRESFVQAKSSGLPIKQYGDILKALRKRDATLPDRLLK